MKLRTTLLLGSFAVAAMIPSLGQSDNIRVPKTVEAGNAFSIQSSGSGSATLYIIGPGQVLKRDLQLGQTISFSVGSLYNAGRYLALLSFGDSASSESFDVLPASKPTDLSFLAKPSRLPVGLQNGITGAVYVFDAWRNLIATPMPVSFQLSNSSGATQTRSVTTRNGAAWTAMDSTPQQGIDNFVAKVADVSSTRVVRQFPGDPCGLKMNAKKTGQQVHLETDPVRDCSGNAVPDGTIVTFTEAYDGTKSTVDVPLKRGIAQVEMPAHDGASISVASGVALGNQIRLEK